MAIEHPPSTTPPPETDPELALPSRSPGAVSEMSGTTAISSFSMVESEFLESRLILRHLEDLYREANRFLSHLVPDDGRIEDDNQHIREIQIPESEFAADYNVYDGILAPLLSCFRTEHQRYIDLCAVHRVLFGANQDLAPPRTGIDLILYLANLLIFAKQMIHSDRNEKEMWNTLLQLDREFPAPFLPTLILESPASESSAGESELLHATFELALDLRTQLAILDFERQMGSGTQGFIPDEHLEAIFFQSESSQGTEDVPILRGWGISALGSDDSVLPQVFQSKVDERLAAMRQFFVTDEELLSQSEAVDLDGLGANFPWKSVVLRLLGWVRLRSRELQTAIQHHGGATSIIHRVKMEIQEPGVVDIRQDSVPQASPRKKRTSFGRHRRRSSRKFDPNQDVSDMVMDKLIAREKRSAVQAEAGSSQAPRLEQGAESSQRQLPEEQTVPSQEAVSHQQEEDDWQPPPDDDDHQHALHAMVEQVKEAVDLSRPPQSTAETLELLREGKKVGKENRGLSFFDRQPTAQRVDFGDGFDDSQPAPGPSREGQLLRRPAPRKRPLFVEDSSSDDDVFEPGPRSDKVADRREKAKRVRIDPSSSGVPTSHQPPPRKASADERANAEESPSEPEAPDMSEAAPPGTAYATQTQLARANTAAIPTARARKPRSNWTSEAEEALIEYMGLFPQRYAQILKHDNSVGHGLLQDRSQVDLKDKVRNMAKNMIK